MLYEKWSEMTNFIYKKWSLIKSNKAIFLKVEHRAVPWLYFSDCSYLCIGRFVLHILFQKIETCANTCNCSRNSNSMLFVRIYFFLPLFSLIENIFTALCSHTFSTLYIITGEVKIALKYVNKLFLTLKILVGDMF